MLRFLVISLLLMTVVAIYLFFYIRRAVCFYSGQGKQRWITVVSVIAAVVFSGCAINVFGMGALILLHVASVAVCMDALNLLLKKTAGKNRPLKTWSAVYRCGLVPLMVTALILGYGYFHMRDVCRTEYAVSVEKPLREEGYKIALITDLHYPTTMEEHRLEKYCGQISKQKPDIVLLGGDIVDERTSRNDMEKAFSALGKISNQFGIYYVYGNHDKALYANNPPFTPEQLEQAIKAQGIKTLCDETVDINGEILLTGRRDRSESSGRAGTAQLLRGKDKRKCLLLLDHQPAELKENAGAGIDLQLSGHTHGGQIWPVGLIIDVLGFGELNYGYKKIASSQFLVSSGIAGWGYPIRTGARSEYVIVNVKGK